MKFHGEPLKALATGTVRLPRPDKQYLEFLVRSTGLGDEDSGSRLFFDPRPPVDFVYDKNGTIMRDPRTDRPIREPNPFDPKYMERVEFAARMQMVVQVVNALSMDEQVTWETTAEPGTKQYYEDIAVEMKEAGITLGDMRLIVEKARELNNLDTKKLQEAAEGFSSAGEASGSPSS